MSSQALKIICPIYCIATEAEMEDLEEGSTIIIMHKI